MKKHNILTSILFSLLFVLSLNSCDEGGEPDPGGTSVEDIAGDWWAIALFDDGTPAYGGDFVQFSTYNTSANDNTFWLDDHDNWLQLKCKVTLNSDRLTFQSEPNTLELYTDDTVTITNGVITRGTYTTTSDTTVDGITFDAEFSWDPGTIYKYEGHWRTGFLEDENPHF